MHGGTRKEIATVGFDPAFQALGSDPYGSGAFTGLILPSAPAATPSPKNRYLCMLAFLRLGPEGVVVIDGIRQYVGLTATTSIGNEEAPQSLVREWEVTSPMWHFPDGNIAWWLMRVPPDWGPLPPYATKKNRQNLAFRYANTPAILFEKTASDVGGYQAPWGGRLPGEVLGGLGPIYDLRFPWRDDHAWEALGITVQGPCDVVLFASVQQTDTTTRPRLVVPGGVTLPAGIDFYAPPEDLFCMNADALADEDVGTRAVYGRIAGSIVLREPSPYWDIPADAQSREWCNVTTKGERTSARAAIPSRGKRTR